MDYFESLYSKSDYPELIEEINKLEAITDMSSYEKEKNLIARWQLFRTDKGAKLLPAIAINLLCILPSSAHVERVFSKLKIIKHDQRGNLHNDTLEAC